VKDPEVGKLGGPPGVGGRLTATLFKRNLQTNAGNDKYKRHTFGLARPFTVAPRQHAERLRPRSPEHGDLQGVGWAARIHHETSRPLAGRLKIKT